MPGCGGQVRGRRQGCAAQELTVFEGFQAWPGRLGGGPFSIAKQVHKKLHGVHSHRGRKKDDWPPGLTTTERLDEGGTGQVRET